MSSSSENTIPFTEALSSSSLMKDSKDFAHFLYKLDQWKSTLSLVNWPTVIFLIISPILCIYGLLTTTVYWKTVLLSFVFYYQGMSAIGTGYHRLYSHRTYKTVYPVEMYLLFWATSSFSMSAIDWVNDHRAHHRFTDTDKDPYNIKRGFWYAHVGWLCWKRKMPDSDVSDLERDPVLRWQHKYFLPLAFFSGWIVPAVICGYFWGDWRGGLFYAAILKSFLLHHGEFTINSWAHYWGETTFSDTITPRDSLPCAIWTCGEGYHNFHHEFPNDYRNGTHWNAMDFNKWFIYTLYWLGLAYDLKRTPEDLIRKGRGQMIIKKIEQEQKTMYWGRELSSLPTYTKEEVAEIVKKNKTKLLIMGDIIFDVSEFLPNHPGGEKILKLYLGKDITSAFNGSVYAHSNAAKNLLQTLRCGKLVANGQ